MKKSIPPITDPIYAEDIETELGVSHQWAVQVISKLEGARKLKPKRTSPWVAPRKSWEDYKQKRRAQDRES